MKIIFTICLFLINIQIFSQVQPNNSCGSASTLPVNSSCVVNTFTMPTTFTNDGYILSGCNVGNTRDDGWFKFQATDVSTTITADATQDIIIHVYSGTCGSFTLVGCADNQISNPEVLTIATTPGTWYLIRIQRYNSSSGLSGGTICIVSSPPPTGNSDCTGPTAMACGDVLTGETTIGNANSNGSWNCHTDAFGFVISTPGEDTYYSVNWTDAAAGGTIRFTLTNVVDANDTYLEFIQVGNPCSNNCTNSAQMDISTGLFTSTNLTSVDFDVPAGIATYYFVVDAQNDGIDSYDISVSCFTTGIALDKTNSCGSSFDPANPNEGLYTTWQPIDGAGVPTGPASLAPPTYNAGLGGSYRICENMYIRNPGWEWLKYVDITPGSCWQNIGNITPNGTRNGFYFSLCGARTGDWSGNLVGGVIDYNFVFDTWCGGSAAWGDGYDLGNNYTCALYTFCFDADVDNTCVDPNGLQNIISATDDGIGGGGGSTGASNIITTYTYSENILPVELIFFDGMLQDNKVLLQWATLSEINNDYFEIQKSFDGKHFITIGKVDGYGNSNHKIDYSFIDNDINEKYQYYRLKQVDYDGRFEYSNIVSVLMKNDLFVNVYPSQAKEIVNLDVKLIEDEAVTLNILDVSGKLIKSIDYALNKGINKKIIDVTFLQKGFYLFSVTGKSFQNQFRVVKE